MNWIMVVGILQTGVMLFILSRVLHTPALYEAFFVQQPSIHAGLVFFGLRYAPVDVFLSTTGQAISRKHEYEANRFAASTTGQFQPMVDALRKLSVHNLSNLTPHP